MPKPEDKDKDEDEDEECIVLSVEGRCGRSVVPVVLGGVHCKAAKGQIERVQLGVFGEGGKGKGIGGVNAARVSGVGTLNCQATVDAGHMQEK